MKKRKTYSMSAILSAICISGLFAVALAFAFYYKTQDKDKHLIWWSYGAWVVFGLGLVFLYYQVVIEPKMAAKSDRPSSTPTDRPWLSVEVIPSSAFITSGDRVKLSVTYQIKNVGHSVANDAAVYSRFFITGIDNFKYVIDEQ